MSKLFLEVNRNLAIKIGLNECIVLNVISIYPENDKKNLNYLNDDAWACETYSSWREQWFPWWSEKTIQRILFELERLNLIETKIWIDPSGRLGQLKHYRINRKRYAEVCDE